VDSLAQAAYHEGEIPKEDTRAVNIANMQPRITLTAAEQDVAEYAVAATRLTLGESTYERRVGTLNYAVGVLTSWHRGLTVTATTTFEPFRYVATNDNGAITVNIYESWT
jgi:hypothetical protein